MLKATCHCGSVHLSIPRRPRSITNCNCSICRRYGTLWAYFQLDEVKVEAAPGVLQSYQWGDRMLDFMRCGQCGCIVQWRPVAPTASSRTGINARMFEPELLGDVKIRRLDGAKTWKILKD